MNKKRKRAFLMSAVLFLVLLGAAGSFLTRPPDDRLTRLQTLTLPPDGLPLYQTLLQEIPDVVSQIPCACCGESLAWCYEGGCPPS